jgi:hypothetical protein
MTLAARERRRGRLVGLEQGGSASNAHLHQSLLIGPSFLNQT